MRSTSLLLLLLLFGSGVKAQTETLDLFKFNQPAGYARVAGKEAIQFTRLTDNNSKYCRITVYATRASTNDVKPEFSKEWELLIKPAHKVEVPTETQTVPPEDGWNVMSGASPVTTDKGSYVIMLVSIVGHQRAGSIMIQINTEDFNADISQFLESVEPQTNLLATLYPTTVAPQQTTGKLNVEVTIEKTSSASSPLSSNELVGIWSGFQLGSTFYGTSSKMKFVAFFEDGSFWNAVGSDGLLNYQQERSKNPDTWGKYQKEKSNEIGNITFGTLDQIFQLKNGVLGFDDVEFRKVPRTDHLKMDGTYTAERDPKAYNGPEPTITFLSNGRFDDHGGIYWVRHVKGYTQDMQDKMTGSGTYDINNYTITFKYDDGRLINLTILDTGSADKSKPATIRLGNSALCYRK